MTHGFKPPLCRPFFMHCSFGSKIEWKLTRHCCICCNPAKGRVDFEDGRLIKSIFITTDEMKACERTRTKLLQKNQYSLASSHPPFWTSKTCRTFPSSTIHLTRSHMDLNLLGLGQKQKRIH